MEYTQNYQLPLWDKEDAVLREDFNAGNSKIDAALAEIRPEMVLLKEYTSTAVTAKHRVSLDGIDLSKYRKLVIVPTILCTGAAQYKFYLNNKAADESVLLYQSGLTHSNVLAKPYTCPTMNVTKVNHFCRVELDLTTPTVLCEYLQFIAYTTSYETSWTFFTAKGTSLHKTLSPAEITEITIEADFNLQIGSTVEIYGVK